MQYSSRIKIVVENSEDWMLLNDISFEQYNLYNPCIELIKNGKKEFCIDMEWSVTERELSKFVYDIVNKLRQKCLIIADTQNINVDSYKYCEFYVGTIVKTKSINLEGWAEKVGNIDINDVSNWLNVTKIKLSDIEKDYLNSKFQIKYLEDKKIFISNSEEKRQTIHNEWEDNKYNENVIYINLYKFQYNGRRERAKKLKVGDEVKLIFFEDEEQVIATVNDEDVGEVDYDATLNYYNENGAIEIKKATVVYIEKNSRLDTRSIFGRIVIKVECKLFPEIIRKCLEEDFKSIYFIPYYYLNFIDKQLMRKCGMLSEEDDNITEILSLEKNKKNNGWKLNGIYSSNGFVYDIPSQVLGMPILEISENFIAEYDWYLPKGKRKNLIIPEGVEIIEKIPKNICNIKLISIPQSIKKMKKIKKTKKTPKIVDYLGKESFYL